MKERFSECGLAYQGEISTSERKLEESSSIARRLHKELSHKAGQVVELERRVAELSRTVHTDPFRALQSTYLTKDIGSLLEASMDFSEIGPELLDIINEGRILTFYEYVQKRYGEQLQQRARADTSSEEKFEQWFEKMIEAPEKWEESEGGRQLLARREQLERDIKFIELAKEQGASDALINAMRSALKDGNIAIVDQEIEGQKFYFGQQIELSNELAKLRVSYQAAQEVLCRAIKRREIEVELPVLATLEKESLRVYLPLLDPANSLTKYIIGKFEKIAEEAIPKYTIQASNKEDSLEVVLAPSSNENGMPLQMVMDVIIQNLKMSHYLNKLGITPKILMLQQR